MKLINHINYFIYIASNWGLRLGWFTIKKEIQGERTYHIDTTATIRLSKLKLKGNQLKHATEYMPANYFTLEALLQRMPDSAKKGTFLDIGCGKGRAMCVAAAHGYNLVEGLDFARELIDAAGKNIERLKKYYPKTKHILHWNDVTSLVIHEHVTTIFLFNPFDEIVMKQVMRKINASLAKKPRHLYVLYCTPRHETLFFNEGFDVTFRIKKFDYLEGVILEKSNAR